MSCPSRCTTLCKRTSFIQSRAREAQAVGGPVSWAQAIHLLAGDGHNEPPLLTGTQIRELLLEGERLLSGGLEQRGLGAPEINPVR